MSYFLCFYLNHQHVKSMCRYVFHTHISIVSSIYRFIYMYILVTRFVCIVSNVDPLANRLPMTMG
ncbi:hypothetical protein HanIR_Chr13g0637681 [Helianthus annuus]|nr:hypothetical protein HanIR_Chr13g0637681 [Helianthus annuus]